ncbi:UvrD-helicase domain-containing protein [Streptomyces sp. NPDC001948]
MDEEALEAEEGNLHDIVQALADSTDPLDLAYRYRAEQRAWEIADEIRRREPIEPERERGQIILDRLLGYGLSNDAPAVSGGDLDQAREQLPPAKPGSPSDDEWARIEAEASAGETYPATPEQQIGIEAVARRRLNVAVRALAGTGKSALIQKISRRLPGKRIALLAFNRSVVEEAKAAKAAGKYSDNIEPMTANGLAFHAVNRRYVDAGRGLKERLPENGGASRQTAQQIADLMRVYDDVPVGPRRVHPAQAAAMARSMLQRWCQSTDTEAGPQHVQVPTFIGEANRGALFESLKPIVERMWADITDPYGTLTYDHEYIVKQWALSGFRIQYDVIAWDEAQDVNPVLDGALRAAMNQGVQVVIVGDANQSIYGFRGATDALSHFPVDVQLTLTQSFRFGDSIAEAGNRFLRLIGTRMRLKGLSGKPAELAELGPDDVDAVLTRTNATAVTEALDALDAGKRVAVAGGLKEIRDFIGAVEQLKETGESNHKDLAAFRSWQQVVDYVDDESEAAGSMRTIVHLIKDDKEGRLDQLLTSEGLADIHLSEDGQRLWVEGTQPGNPEHQAFTDWLKERKTNGFGKLVYDGSSRRWYYQPGRHRASFVKDGQTISYWVNNPANSLADARLAIEAHITAHTPEPEPGQGGIVAEHQDPDVTISTAHKSKGLEWPRVRIASDFVGPELDQAGNIQWDTMPDDALLRLAYVAFTRATETLDPGSLGWVLEATADKDPLERPTGIYRRKWTTDDFAPGRTVAYEAEDGSFRRGTVLSTEPPTILLVRNDDSHQVEDLFLEQVLSCDGHQPPQLPVADDTDLDRALAQGHYQPPSLRTTAFAPATVANPATPTVQPSAPTTARTPSVTPAAPISGDGPAIYHAPQLRTPATTPGATAETEDRHTRTLIGLYDRALQSNEPAERTLRAAATGDEDLYNRAFDSWFADQAPAGTPAIEAMRQTLQHAIALASRPSPVHPFPNRETGKAGSALLAHRASQWIEKAKDHVATQHRTFKTFANAWKSADYERDHGPMVRAARHTRTLIRWVQKQHPEASADLIDGLNQLASQADQLVQRWEQDFEEPKISDDLRNAARGAEPYGGPDTPYRAIAPRLWPDRDGALDRWQKLRSALCARVPADDALLLEMDVLTLRLREYNAVWNEVATADQARLLAYRIAERDPGLREAATQHTAAAWTYATRLMATASGGVHRAELLARLSESVEADAAETTSPPSVQEPLSPALVLHHTPTAIPRTFIENLPDEAADLATSLGFQPAPAKPTGTYALPDHWTNALRGRRAQALTVALRRSGHTIALIDEHPPGPGENAGPFSEPEDHAQSEHTAAAAVVEWSQRHLSNHGSDVPRHDEDWSTAERTAWSAARTALNSLTTRHIEPQGAQDTPPSASPWRDLLSAAEALDEWNHLAPASLASATLIEALDLYLARWDATADTALLAPTTPSPALTRLLAGDATRALVERPTIEQRRSAALARVTMGEPGENGRRPVSVDGEPTGHRLADDLHGWILYHDNGAISDPYETEDEALHEAVRAADLRRFATPSTPSPTAVDPQTSHPVGTTVPVESADVPRWEDGAPQIAIPAEAAPLPDHPGYLQHTDPETGTIAVFAAQQFIGRSEPFTNSRAQIRYRNHLGDDQLFNGKSSSDAVNRIAEAHAALTGPLPERTGHAEDVWIEHHDQATRIHGSEKDDREVHAALQLSGSFRPHYERTAGRKTFQYWAMSSKLSREERTEAVERLVTLMASRGRALIRKDQTEAADAATPATGPVSSSSPAASDIPDLVVDTSAWPADAEPVPGKPGFWLLWEPAQEFNPYADYHDYTRYVQIGHGATTIARATSPRQDGKKWTLLIGGDHLTGAATIEGTAQIAVRHWQLLHSPAAIAKPVRDPMWVEHNETTTIVHGFTEGDEQAWAALRLADFGRIGKTDTIGLRRVRDKDKNLKEMHFGTRSHKSSLLVGSLAHVGRIVEVHPSVAARTAALATPEPDHFTAQDHKQASDVRESGTEGRWSPADFHPGDEVRGRSLAYWRRVEEVDAGGVVTSDGDRSSWREILARRREGKITRADTPPDTSYARPLATPVRDLDDEAINAELQSLTLPPARPEHATLITARSNSLKAEAERRRERATQAEEQRSLFAAGLEIPGVLEKAGALVLHDEDGILLGAVISEGRRHQFINRDGYLRGFPEDTAPLAQDALFKELEQLEAAAPDGWRPAPFTTLTPGETIRLPGTERSWGDRRIKVQSATPGDPFEYATASWTPTGELTVTGLRERQPVSLTLKPDEAALGAFRRAAEPHAYNVQHRVLHAARTRIKRALTGVGPVPITGAKAWKDVRATVASVLRRPVTPAELATRLPKLVEAANAFAQTYTTDRSDRNEELTALADVATSLATTLQHAPTELLREPAAARPSKESDATDDGQQPSVREEPVAGDAHPAEAGRRRDPLPIGTRHASEMTDSERSEEEAALRAYRWAMDHSIDPGSTPDGAVSQGDIERRLLLNRRHREFDEARQAEPPPQPETPAEQRPPQAETNPVPLAAAPAAEDDTEGRSAFRIGSGEAFAFVLLPAPLARRAGSLGAVVDAHGRCIGRANDSQEAESVAQAYRDDHDRLRAAGQSTDHLIHPLTEAELTWLNSQGEHESSPRDEQPTAAEATVSAEPAPSDPSEPGAPGTEATEPPTGHRHPRAFKEIDTARRHLATLDDHRARAILATLHLDNSQLTADGNFIVAKSTSTHSREGIRHKGRWYILHARTAVVVGGYDGDTSKTSALAYAKILATATDMHGAPIPWADLSDHDAASSARIDANASMEQLTAQENDRQAEAEDGKRAGSRSAPHAFARRADMVAHWRSGGRYSAYDGKTGSFMRYWSSDAERQTLHLSVDGQFTLIAYRTGWEVCPAGDAIAFSASGQRLKFNSRTKAEAFAANLAAIRRSDGTTLNWANPSLHAEITDFTSDRAEPLGVAVLRAYADTYADGKGIPQGIDPAALYLRAAAAAANNGAGENKKFAEDIKAGDLLHGILPRHVTLVENIGQVWRITTSDGETGDYERRDTLQLFEKNAHAARAATGFDGTVATRVYTAELKAGDVVEFEASENVIARLSNSEPDELRNWNGRGTWRVVGIVNTTDGPPGTHDEGAGLQLDAVRAWRKQWSEDGSGWQEHTPGTDNLHLDRYTAPGIVTCLGEHDAGTWNQLRAIAGVRQGERTDHPALVAPEYPAPSSDHSPGDAADHAAHGTGPVAEATPASPPEQPAPTGADTAAAEAELARAEREAVFDDQAILKAMGGRLVKDETKTLLGAVIKIGDKFAAIDRDGYLVKIAGRKRDAVQYLYWHADTAEESAPAGWRRAAWSTLTEGEQVRLPEPHLLSTASHHTGSLGHARWGESVTIRTVTRNPDGSVAVHTMQDSASPVVIAAKEARAGVVREAVGDHAMPAAQMVARQAREAIRSVLQGTITDVSYPMPHSEPGQSIWNTHQQLLKAGEAVARRPATADVLLLLLTAVKDEARTLAQAATAAGESLIAERAGEVAETSGRWMTSLEEASATIAKALRVQATPQHQPTSVQNPADVGVEASPSTDAATAGAAPRDAQAVPDPGGTETNMATQADPGDRHRVRPTKPGESRQREQQAEPGSETVQTNRQDGSTQRNGEQAPDWTKLDPRSYGLDGRQTAPPYPPVEPVHGQVELPPEVSLHGVPQMAPSVNTDEPAVKDDAARPASEGEQEPSTELTPPQASTDAVDADSRRDQTPGQKLVEYAWRQSRYEWQPATPTTLPNYYFAHAWLLQATRWTVRGIRSLLPPPTALANDLRQLLKRLSEQPGDRIPGETLSAGVTRLNDATDEITSLIRQITRLGEARTDLYTWAPVRTELDELASRVDKFQQLLRAGIPHKDPQSGEPALHVPLQMPSAGNVLRAKAARKGDRIVAKDGLPARITDIRRGNPHVTRIRTDADGDVLQVHPTHLLTRADHVDTGVYDPSGNRIGTRIRTLSAKAGDRISFVGDWRTLDVLFAGNGILLKDIDGADRPAWLKVEATVDATHRGIETVPLTDILIQHPDGAVEHVDHVAFANPPQHIVRLEHTVEGKDLTRHDLIPKALQTARLTAGDILVHEGRHGALVLESHTTERGAWAYLRDQATGLHSYRHFDTSLLLGLPANDQTIAAALRYLQDPGALGIDPQSAGAPVTDAENGPAEESRLWAWASTQTDALVRALHRADPTNVDPHTLTVISTHARDLRRYEHWRLHPQALLAFRDQLLQLFDHDSELGRFVDAAIAAHEYAAARLHADAEVLSKEQWAAVNHYADQPEAEDGQVPSAWRRRLVTSTPALRDLLRTTPPSSNEHGLASARTAAAGAPSLDLVNRLAIYKDTENRWRIVLPASGADLIPPGRATDATHAAWLAETIQARVTDAENEPFPFDAPNASQHLPFWRTGEGGSLHQALQDLLSEIAPPPLRQDHYQRLREQNAEARRTAFTESSLEPGDHVMTDAGPARWIRVEECSEDHFTGHLIDGEHSYDTIVARLRDGEVQTADGQVEHLADPEPLHFTSANDRGPRPAGAELTTAQPGPTATRPTESNQRQRPTARQGNNSGAQPYPGGDKATSEQQPVASSSPGAQASHQRQPETRGAGRRRQTAPAQDESLFPVDDLVTVPQPPPGPAGDTDTSLDGNDKTRPDRPTASEEPRHTEPVVSADGRLQRSPMPDSNSFEVYLRHKDGSISFLCLVDEAQEGQWVAAGAPAHTGPTWEAAAGLHERNESARRILGPGFTSLTLYARTSSSAVEAADRLKEELGRLLDSPVPVPGPTLLCQLGERPIYFAALDHPALGRVVDMGLDPGQRPIARVTRAAVDAHSAVELLSGLVKSTTTSQPNGLQDVDEVVVRQAAEGVLAAQQRRLAAPPRPRPAESVGAARNREQSAVQTVQQATHATTSVTVT